MIRQSLFLVQFQSSPFQTYCHLPQSPLDLCLRLWSVVEGKGEFVFPKIAYSPFPHFTFLHEEGILALIIQPFFEFAYLLWLLHMYILKISCVFSFVKLSLVSLSDLKTFRGVGDFLFPSSFSIHIWPSECSCRK